MATKRIVTSLVVVLVLAGCALPAGDDTVEKADRATPVVVGTFDSRAVAIACIRSKWLDERHGKVRAELKKAEAAGDTAKVEEIKESMIELQKKFHMQGFGTADVSEYLDLIKDDIPKIAKEAGVDVIVSKWDIAYHDPSVKFVDVTEQLVQPFEPTQETLKGIRSMKNVAPVPAEELEKMGHEHD